MRIHCSDDCRQLVLIAVATVLAVGCTVESPVAPSALETIGGSNAVAQSAVTNQSLALGFANTGGDQAGPTLTWTGSVTREGLPFADLTTTTDAATWTPRGASGKAFDVQFVFEITRGASVMVLDLTGLLNLPAPSSNGPGLVNLNGVVVEASGEFAALAGARVHEQGRLVGVSNGATSWEGVIRVMTGSAN